MPCLYLSNTCYGVDVPRVQVHAVILKVLQDHLQVVRQDGHEVDGVQHAASKTPEVRGGNQAQQVLQGEEGDAETLDALTVEPSAGLARGRLQQNV